MKWLLWILAFVLILPALWVIVPAEIAYRWQQQDYGGAIGSVLPSILWACFMFWVFRIISRPRKEGAK